MKTMRIHELAKAEFLAEATSSGFPQIVDILSRGPEDALVLKSSDEAVLIVDLLIYMKNRMELKYPYHDEEHPCFNPVHEDIVDNFIQTTWQKTLSTLKTEFDVLWPGERKAA